MKKLSLKNYRIQNNDIRKGFSTLELLFYVVGMTVTLAVIFYLITSMYSFYRNLTVEPRVSRVAGIVLDRITKDVRSGQSINLSGSQFNVSTGQITINAKENGVDISKVFSYDEGRITYQEAGGEINYLTPDDLSVSNFNITHVTSPISEGVRIELEITYDLEEEPTTREFSSFVILRHSYE
jgi:hypothetical protein